MVLDKSATYAAAREVGFPSATWQPRDGPMMEAPPEGLRFHAFLNGVIRKTWAMRSASSASPF